MKKIISLVLALAMMLALSVTAFAATNNGGASSIEVTGTYAAGQSAAKLISVDITWDTMSFTYTGANAGVWNPQTHSYDGTANATWGDKTAATITVKNHSNDVITATFAFDAGNSGATGSFSGDDLTGNVLTLETAEGTQYNAAPTGRAIFNIGGAITASGKIGTISVTIAQKTNN